MEDEHQKSDSFICQKSDKFSSLEIKLFKKYPSLKNKSFNYLINNKEIDISKTLEENNIADGSIIYYKMQEINNEEDEIPVIIQSYDQTIKSSFICKKRDKFKVLQQKLYEKYPNLKEKEHYYLCRGGIIDIEKTIEENKIKDSDILIIKEIEEDEEDEEINVNITSSDQNINVSIKCKKNDKFKVLEEKLYEKYPNLRFKNHHYLCNANYINIEKSIEENRIKDNDALMIFNENEEDEEINVNIISSDQNINASIKCKKSDKFKVLDEKLYEKYPNLKNENHFYVCNGITIDIEKTIKDNNIKDNDQILYNIDLFDREV